jgi:hypothetical protein
VGATEEEEEEETVPSFAWTDRKTGQAAALWAKI